MCHVIEITRAERLSLKLRRGVQPCLGRSAGRSSLRLCQEETNTPIVAVYMMTTEIKTIHFRWHTGVASRDHTLGTMTETESILQKTAEDCATNQYMRANRVLRGSANC